MKMIPYCRDIFYYETDRMNVVSHTNYIRWMEEARTDFLRQAGMAYDQIEAEGLMIPVLEVRCQYRQSLTYGDRFAIVSRITEYNSFKMKIAYEIYNARTGTLSARASSAHCFTDSSMKPVRISKRNPTLHALFLKSMDAEYSAWDYGAE
ncbi:MAG: acyl-CoA thioesterase [Ruminococcus sp.]|nr:acyl-CoA thioesterase [Ruminococcus sp.]